MKNKVALIDYGMGNLNSVARALRHVGAEVEIVSSAAALAGYPAAVLPGVGNFGDGGRNLENLGFYPALRDFAASGKPLLGICLGMQLMLERSEEAPGVPGLGIIRGEVKRFPDGQGEKVPHMGWNEVFWKSGAADKLFSDGSAGGKHDNYYFVHSYYALPESGKNILGKCGYIFPFAAAIGDGGKVFGTQFHPEKSQTAGLSLLKNFVAMAE